MQNRYIWLNGEYHKADAQVLKASNRAFHYGDGLFETIHCYGTEPLHIDLHYDRLAKGLRILEIELSQLYTPKKFKEIITKLLNKNRLFGSTRVRITVFRDGEGFYTPKGFSASILIESQPLQSKLYEYNQQGLVIDIYNEIKKPINILSPVKSCNSLLYVKAGLYRLKKGLDECVVLNEKGRIAESISSNIFIVKKGEIFTPGVGEGCIPGVMRKVVINLAKKIGYNVYDDVAINTKVFNNCDEVFLTNAITGIRWVLGVGINRYFNTLSKNLSAELNKQILNQLV
ncbi:MAG: branched-chain amino acid aminotransferase [Tenuifilum sp.]|jgi:branched-chain amino acid aminotransferase|uniref:aminotransferase class IV n=1 Tax=Tenuifilum sp. TaxID=2760880 RepID=UPI0024AB7F48|nr:aminotransferase class IV [Tenuifilum sp.]MDI3527210.1 branched-chain amino acid aminotransferase [Tenuifilum sp.]